MGVFRAKVKHGAVIANSLKTRGIFQIEVVVPV
jgi:hypothetical protein